MKILVTGGSGDLGTLLIRDLVQRGDAIVNVDVQPPQLEQGIFLQSSITDYETLSSTMQGIDLVVHIAAWHGIHEFRGDVNARTFWDVNATGTFNIFESAHQNNVPHVIYISSTSVDDPYSTYGMTKVIGEAIAERYHHSTPMTVLTLRPRAFIPHWNRYAYNNYIEWARWFWRGAVHINDVKQGVLLAIDALHAGKIDDYHALNLDSAYQYTDDDLAQWDIKGAGSTFRKYYADYEALAAQYDLDITQKPRTKPIQQTRDVLGYDPQYSLLNLLKELAQYGEDGAPAPF